MDINLFYLYRYVFLIQLIIGESIFLIKAKRRNFFVLRLLVSLGVIFTCNYFIEVLRRALPFNVSTIYCYILLFLFTFAGMFFCFRIKIFAVLFAGAGGYAMQHIFYGLESIFFYYVSRQSLNSFALLTVYFLPSIIAAVSIYFLLIKRTRYFEIVTARDKRAAILALIVVAVNIVVSKLPSYVENADKFITNVVCRLYSIVSSVLVLWVEFGCFSQHTLKFEKEVMSEIMEKAELQHRLSKENIELINIKCHDIKNQISILKSTKNPEERMLSIEEVERVVTFQDCMAKTGNETLDVILSEKSISCEKNNITLVYILDGSDFSFIESTDLYLLFCNALDNAIQSVIKEEDEEKRFISIKCEKSPGNLYLHIENYCNSPIEFIEDLPITTKTDKKLHGFGLKSMKYIVKKYDGDMMIEFKSNIFNPDILFPL